MVYLSGKKTVDEPKLTETLTEQLELSKIPSVNHYSFDFHGDRSKKLLDLTQDLK